ALRRPRRDSPRPDRGGAQCGGDRRARILAGDRQPRAAAALFRGVQATTGAARGEDYAQEFRPRQAISTDECLSGTLKFTLRRSPCSVRVLLQRSVRRSVFAVRCSAHVFRWNTDSPYVRRAIVWPVESDLSCDFCGGWPIESAGIAAGE